MSWGTYVMRLLVSGGLFTGLVALSLAARGLRGWWVATGLGAAVLILLALSSGERGTRLVLSLVLLVLALGASASVVRWRAAGGRRLLLPWMLGTGAFILIWLLGAALLFRPR